MEHKDQLLSFGFVRAYCVQFQLDIPTDIMSLVFAWYHIRVEILKWCTKYHWKSIKLLDDNKVIQQPTYGDGGPAWALPNIEPVYKGIHCWRIKVRNYTSYHLATYKLIHCIDRAAIGRLDCILHQ